MRMLKSKLLEIKERENLERIEDIKGVQKEIAWVPRSVRTSSCHIRWSRTIGLVLKRAISMP